MKLALVFAAVLAVSAAAAPPAFAAFGSPYGLPLRSTPTPPRPANVNRVASSDQAANVLRYDNDGSPEGGYNYALEIDNGIAAEAQGTLRDYPGNPPAAAVVSRGSFSWTSPEGQPIVITYIADENGYQPIGDAIPTPHPVPELIARALEYVSKVQKK